MAAHAPFGIVLAAYRGWGWWWWIAFVCFIWLLLLPPFGLGRRRIYRDARLQTQWQRIEAQFVASPASAVMEADAFVANMLSARGVVPESIVGYRDAHEIALKAQGGNASTDELRAAMMAYRSAIGTTA
jgi:hypothetical protein